MGFRPLMLDKHPEAVLNPLPVPGFNNAYPNAINRGGRSNLLLGYEDEVAIVGARGRRSLHHARTFQLGRAAFEVRNITPDDLEPGLLIRGFEHPPADALARWRDHLRRTGRQTRQQDRADPFQETGAWLVVPEAPDRLRDCESMDATFRFIPEVAKGVNCAG